MQQSTSKVDKAGSQSRGLIRKETFVKFKSLFAGIGEHMAYEYARLGAKVGLIARRGEKLEEVAEEAR
jgi:hypothetical protein